MSNPATMARESAVHFEAKKTGFGQAQDGWSLTLRVQHDDLPAHIKDARKGTRYMVALVEIGDNEEPVQRPAVTAADKPRPVSAPTTPPPAGATKERNKIAQRAGILCNERLFRLFLADKFDMPLPDPEEAASVVRHHCKVKSRRDITPDNADWSGLVLAYQLWVNAPAVVPA